MMKKNIIKNADLKEHKIEHYKFKTLNQLSKDHSQEQTIEQSQDQEIDEIFIEDEESESFKEEELAPINEAMASSHHHQGSEELLKRIEELSENIIKLQMKMESQEEDFSKRLESEVKLARDNAYEQGLEASKAAHEEELAKRDATLSSSLSKLAAKESELVKFLNKCEEELPATAIDIAKEVINKELESSSAKIAKALAKGLLREVAKDASVKISVNPADYALLEELSSDYIKIYADDAISPGCLLFLSDQLNREEKISSRLAAVKAML